MALAWPWFVGLLLARQVKNKRDAQVEAEVARQTADKLLRLGDNPVIRVAWADARAWLLAEGASAAPGHSLNRTGFRGDPDGWASGGLGGRR